jgi:hypothetical protein
MGGPGGPGLGSTPARAGRRAAAGSGSTSVGTRRNVLFGALGACVVSDDKEREEK